MADKEILWEIKQDVLDSLSYKDTIEYVAIQNKQQTGTINNDLLNLVDQTLKLADEGIARVETPEYLMRAFIEESEQPKESKTMVFQRLLQ